MMTRLTIKLEGNGKNEIYLKNMLTYVDIYCIITNVFERRKNKIRPIGQAVKTSPFHGGNTGSIPVWVI